MTEAIDHDVQADWPPAAVSEHVGPPAQALVAAVVTVPQPRWDGARHSTSQMPTAYLCGMGRLAFDPKNRSEMRRVVRQWLRVARTPAEKRRVMDVWRYIHYLGKGGGAVFPPRTIRLSYYLDLPALRPVPHPWYPAACVTIRFALPGGIPPELGLDSPMEALEIARNFLADDLRWPAVPDLAPEILREVVRRMRVGTDWAEVVAGRVLWKPRWLLSFSDPAVGHDGGLYRGAGALYLGTTVGGKEVWGWPLSQDAVKEMNLLG